MLPYDTCMALIGTHNMELADGRVIVLRDPEVGDAPAMVQYAHRVLTESNDLLMEPDEFAFTTEQEQQWIAEHRDHPRSFALLADCEGKVIGLLDFRVTERRRERHRGSFGVSLRAAFRGQGIGTRMMELMLDWGRQHHDIEKIGLSAFSTNEQAIELYRRLGFTELARSPKHFKLADGSYADNVIMYQFV